MAGTIVSSSGVVESAGGGTVESGVAIESPGSDVIVSPGGVVIESPGGVVVTVSPGMVVVSVGAAADESAGSAASVDKVVPSLPQPAPMLTNTRRLPSDHRRRALQFGKVDGPIIRVASPFIRSIDTVQPRPEPRYCQTSKPLEVADCIWGSPCRLGPRSRWNGRPDNAISLKRCSRPTIYPPGLQLSTLGTTGTPGGLMLVCQWF